MKSKRAKEAIERYRQKFTAGFVTQNEVDVVKEYCRLFAEVVELAEQDAEDEITRYRTELEESKKREELARKVIDDQRKEMEKLKERAVCAFDSLDFTEFMTAECVQDFDNVKCKLRGLLIQKLNNQ